MGWPLIREFTTGATRNTDEGKLDYEGFLSPLVLERYAQYMDSHRKQADGVLRDSDNWQKGMPRAAYMKSLWRHFMDVWTLWRSPEPRLVGPAWNTMQDALCAVLFNVMGLLHELLIGRDVKELPDSGGNGTAAFPESAEHPKGVPLPPCRATGGVHTDPFYAGPLHKCPDCGMLSPSWFLGKPPAAEKKPVRMDCPQWPKPPALDPDGLVEAATGGFSARPAECVGDSCCLCPACVSPPVGLHTMRRLFNEAEKGLPPSLRIGPKVAKQIEKQFERCKCCGKWSCSAP